MRNSILAFALGVMLSVLLLLAVNGLCQLLIAYRVHSPLKLGPTMTFGFVKTGIDGPKVPRNFAVATSFSRRPQVSLHPSEIPLDPGAFSSNAEINRPLNFLFDLVDQGVFRFRANLVFPVLCTQKQTGQMIYDTVYTIGPDRLRATPPTAPMNRSRYAVFLGDSFTFGDGVKDNETMPYYFQHANSTYRSYNMGMMGDGPNDILVRGRLTPLRSIVQQADGVIIYTYIDAHLERLKGSLRYLGIWGAFHPALEDLPGKGIEVAGMFKDAQPLWSTFAGLFMATSFAQYFKVNYPFFYSEEDERFFAAALAKIRDEYTGQLAHAEFYVLLYPGSRWATRLIPYLEQMGIHYLDYSNVNLSTLTTETAFFPWDGHPQAVSHRIVGEQLSEDLQRYHGLREAL